jgi:enterochelin esterase-like enzyme
VSSLVRFFKSASSSTKKHTGIKKEHLGVEKNFTLRQNFAAADVNIGCLNPQLNKTRKIWALLPHDYDSSEESYPVMYLQDAQNLFNEKMQNTEIGKWTRNYKCPNTRLVKLSSPIRTCRRRSFERIQCRETVLGRVIKNTFVL